MNGIASDCEREHCHACPVPKGLACYCQAGMCSRAAQPGQDAFRAALVKHATIRAEQAAQGSESPSFLRKVVSFGTAVVKHVAAGRPMASDEAKATRLSICHACFEYNNGSCRLCGCGLSTKAGWADQECPAGKWLAIVLTPPEPALAESATV